MEAVQGALGMRWECIMAGTTFHCQASYTQSQFGIASPLTGIFLVSELKPVNSVEPTVICAQEHTQEPEAVRHEC